MVTAGRRADNPAPESPSKYWKSNDYSPVFNSAIDQMSQMFANILKEELLLKII